MTLAPAFVLAAATACEPIAQPGLGPDVRRGLDRGRDAATAWIARGRAGAPVDVETAIALGYLERLRLGLGSPFRLVDYALADPRLSDTTRADLGWALLARTVDRLAYQIDPAALDRVGAGGIRSLPESGSRHIRLIEDAIRESADPRAGELAVRLAYALGAAEGSLSESAPTLAARAAALLRDREIARADALRLLRAAQAERRSPFPLLHDWRADRSFEVERPPLAALPLAAELAATELAPTLAGTLRELGLRVDEIRHRATVPRPRSLLTREAALALHAVLDSIEPPPQAPIAIAARSYRSELLRPASLTDRERARRTRFVDEAVSEERFVADLAMLAPLDGREPALGLAPLAAAVGMRSYAQEPVWYPGFGGPSARELEERYGLAAVRFADEVPADWRPYYRRLLDLALSDLYRVLPALDLRGLRVEFGSERPGQEGTLALHDPKERRLLLPPATAAGTIAHEVAHDLDWQVALRKYRVRGDYASDRASRTNTDRLALSLQDLAGNALGPDWGDDRLAAHARRPAEIFARSIDWFVAVSLAAQGRVNGYLSSVQDDLLTGYGTVRPPDVTGTAGNALVTILDEVAPVYPATRQSFLNSYGPHRSLTPYDLIRTVLSDDYPTADDATAFSFAAQGPAHTQAAFAEIERAREAGFDAIDTWVCRSPAAPYNRPLEAARRRLVVEAAASRARGLAIRLARTTAGSIGASWTTYQLLGAPWPRVQLDSATAVALRPLADHAGRAGHAEIGTEVVGIGLISAPDRCSTASPLAR